MPAKALTAGPTPSSDTCLPGLPSHSRRISRITQEQCRLAGLYPTVSLYPSDQNLEAMAKSVCIRCGVKSGLHQPGIPIKAAMTLRHSHYEFDRPWTRDLVTPCFSCLRIVDYKRDVCKVCRACRACCRLANKMRDSEQHEQGRSSEFKVSQTCDHREILGHAADPHRQNSRPSPIERLGRLNRDICERLDYSSAIAFRKTCHILRQCTYTPTLQNYFEKTRVEKTYIWGCYVKEYLRTFREQKLIPQDAQPCEYCQQFRSPAPSLTYYWRTEPLDRYPMGSPLDSSLDSNSDPGSELKLENLQVFDPLQSHDLGRGGFPSPCPGCLCCQKCVEQARTAVASGRVSMDVKSAWAPKQIGIVNGYCNHHGVLRELKRGPLYPIEKWSLGELDPYTQSQCIILH